jgi:hypothetical protein
MQKHQIQGLEQFKSEDRVGPWYFVDDAYSTNFQPVEQEVASTMEEPLQPHAPLEPPSEEAFLYQQQQVNNLPDAQPEDYEYNRQIMEYLEMMEQNGNGYSEGYQQMYGM